MHLLEAVTPIVVFGVGAFQNSSEAKSRLWVASTRVKVNGAISLVWVRNGDGKTKLGGGLCHLLSPKRAGSLACLEAADTPRFERRARANPSYQGVRVTTASF